MRHFVVSLDTYCTMTKVLGRCSTLTVSGLAVVENLVLFPGGMQCIYRKWNSTMTKEVLFHCL